MLRSMRSQSHDVWTGVCVLPITGGRQLGSDVAHVHWGHMEDAVIERYVLPGAWRGKAGGYNLQDRIDAGWPIRYDGEPSTIMGLPLPLLNRLLEIDAS